MRVMPPLLLAIALGAVAGPAAGEQSETGTRLAAPKSRNVGSVAMTSRDQAVGAKRMAECLYNRKGTLARQALLASSANESNAALARMMGEVTCFGDNASNDLVMFRVAQIPDDILRGMLAEAAFKRDSRSAEALQPMPIQQIYQRKWFAITGRHLTVDEMGACIADTNPAGVLALARTVPTSKEESAAFSALGGNLGTCLRAGTKLQASRQALRAALSDALYQRINAPEASLITAATSAAEAAKK